MTSMVGWEQPLMADVQRVFAARSVVGYHEAERESAAHDGGPSASGMDQVNAHGDAFFDTKRLVQICAYGVRGSALPECWQMLGAKTATDMPPTSARNFALCRRAAGQPLSTRTSRSALSRAWCAWAPSRGDDADRDSRMAALAFAAVDAIGGELTVEVLVPDFKGDCRGKPWYVPSTSSIPTPDGPGACACRPGRTSALCACCSTPNSNAQAS
jgi:hypothetical protein